MDCIATVHRRRRLLAEGKIEPLPGPAWTAADKAYLDTAIKLSGGLERVLESYRPSSDPDQKRIHRIWLGSPDETSRDRK